MGSKKQNTIDQYIILDTIDKDEYWCIYDVINDENQEHFWLHQILPDIQCTDTFFVDFIDRASNLSKLDHTSLLRIISYGTTNDIAYLVTKQFPSEIIAGYNPGINKNRNIAKRLSQVASATTFLHENSFVHGQISLRSIRYNQDQIKVLQYGFIDLIRKEIIRHSPNCMISLGIGNIDFLAPELIAGKENTPASDIFALGVVLFKLISGNTKATASSILEKTVNRIQFLPAWPKGIRKTVPPTFLSVIQKALAENPEQRYKSMQEFWQVLNKLGEGKHFINPLSSNLRNKLPGHQLFAFLWRILLVSLMMMVIIGFWLSFDLPNPVEYLEKINLKVTQPIENLSTKTIIPTEAVAQQSFTSTPKPTNEPNNEMSDLFMENQNFPYVEGESIVGNYNVITTENVIGITEIARLGKGEFGQAAFNPLNSNVALATSSGVYIYDDFSLSSPQFIDTKGWATSIEYSPDGQMLAIGLLNGEILIWSIGTNNVVSEFSGHTGEISDFVFTPNGKFLISSSYDRTIKMWDIQNQIEVKTIVAHSRQINAIDISQDGRFLLTGSDDRLVKLWDIANAKSLMEYSMTKEVLWVAFEPGSDLIVAGGVEQTYKWSTKTNLRRVDPVSIPIDFYPDEPDQHTSISVDGKNAAISFSDGLFRVVDIKTKRELGKVVMAYDDLHQLAFSPNSKIIAASGYSEATIWNLNSALEPVKSNGFLANGEPFSPDSKSIIIRGEKGEIKILNTNNGKLEAVFDNPPEDAPVVFLRNGRMVIASSLNQTKAWDIPADVEIYQKSGRSGACRTVSAVHDSEVLAVFTTIQVFSETNSSIIWICSKLEKNNLKIFSTNNENTLLAYKNSDGLLELWNTDSEQRIWRISTEHPINTIVFSPDNQLIVVGSADSTVSVISVSDGKEISTFPGGYSSINNIKFSPNGEWFASAGFDGVIRIWGVFEGEK